MNIELVKKIRKENPLAYFSYIKNGIAYYKTVEFCGEPVYRFEIPVNDMGEAKFEEMMDSKYLIRWLVTDPPADNSAPTTSQQFDEPRG